MKRVCAILLLSILCFISDKAAGQTIQHWETVVYDSMQWRYWPGTADPGANWQSPAFNDQGWQQGRGGIGYGDGDDRTIISPVLSVFLRKKFMITNRDKILEAILHMDYDDGFIAYLNGVEIARAFMPAGNVAFNQGSSGLHESLIYQGLPPEGFILKKEILNTLLVAGENTLAIQVHNDNLGSSDLSSSAFFSVGIIDNSTTYLPTPTWFIEPLDFTSSNLPIVIINTNGLSIPDDPKIMADMGIIDNGVGNRNQVTDAFNNYNGKIGIETRGESSQSFPKKSFAVETRNADGTNFNAALLGMPPENDWILYGPYSDKSLIRNVLAYTLGRDLGNYASRTRFVELMINGRYEGLYVLMEKIKRDKGRVDIASLKPLDISGDEVTGGYILRVDKLDGNDFPGWQATPVPQLIGERDLTFQYFDPPGEVLVNAQRSYIQNYMKDFQSSLTTLNYANATSGYRQYLDLPSTFNFMLVNEVSKNIDGFVFSTYLYKDKDSKGGKLHMGPLWDFNLAFGNVNYLANAQYAPGWMWDDQYRMFWFRRLVQDPFFANQLNCRWHELRSGFLTNSYFNTKIDSIAAVLQESQARNFQRWPVLGTYVWPNQFIGQTYAQEINFLKQWIAERLAWMDANMVGDCSLVTGAEETYGFEFFPNPFNQYIQLKAYNSLNTCILKIYNGVGKEVFTTRFAVEFQWAGTDLLGNQLPAGLYFLKLFDEQGNLQFKTNVVKQ
ncbi:MAG: CotH kinase family protein [Cyclobacteriaceae bacterium]|nr:CotH kinase family protein [Cyclobacteriaceae bacterium]